MFNPYSDNPRGETYLEMRKRHTEEVDSLPIFYAFDNKQLHDALEKMGATKDDKVTQIGAGAFCLKRDVDDIRFRFRTHADELFEAMSDPAFAYDAFLYELENCEYFINYEGDYDVCSRFGRCHYVDGKTGSEYLTEIGYEPATVAAYDQAVNALARTWNEREEW